MADCLTEIQSRYQDLSPEEAKALVQRAREIVASVPEGAPARSRAIKRAAKKSAEELEAKALEREYQAMLRLTKRQGAEDFINRDAKLADNFSAFLVGSPTRKAGNMLSIDAQQKTLANTIESRVIGTLESEGVPFAKVAKDKDWNAQVARELWALQEGRTTVTGNEVARRVAEVLDEAKEQLRTAANENGAQIRRLGTHVMTQVHDQTRIYRAGFAKWKADVLPLLDLERTFEGVDVDRALREMWEGFVTGHRPVIGDDTEFLAAGSLARRLSESRSLHFRDADAWMAYNAAYGGKDVVPGIMQGLHRLAQNVVLLETLGPNPDMQFKRLLSRVKQTLASRGQQMKPAAERALENQWFIVSGKDVLSGDSNFGRVLDGLRQINSMSKLGGAVIPSMADMVTSASTANYHGKGFLSAYGDLVTNLVQRPSVERRALARQLAVAVDGAMGEVARRFNVADGVPGVLSKASNTFFKWNGLTWWTDRMRDGFGLMMSNHIADNLSRAWDGLDEGLRRGLGQYGITADDWRVLQAIVPQEMEGRRYLTGDDVAALGGQATLERKLRTFFVEEAHYAVPESGARERALMLQGTQRGTIPGELMRSFWQFRSFPLAMAMKHWPRWREQGVPATVLVAMQMWAMGYLSMSLKDIVAGKTPAVFGEDPALNARIGARALVTSGGMGIVGDLIFNDYRQYGRGLAEVVGGPTMEMAGDAAGLFSGMMRGEPDAAKAFNTALRNTPYVNLFYTRTALDYFFTFAVQDALNPGYLRRMERRMEQRSGQRFFVPPSQAVRDNPIHQALR